MLLRLRLLALVQVITVSLVTFTATDDCGNATSATQTITIVDTTAPVLSIPADYTAECSDAHPMDDASATDNCGEVVD